MPRYKSQLTALLISVSWAGGGCYLCRFTSPKLPRQFCIHRCNVYMTREFVRFVKMPSLSPPPSLNQMGAWESEGHGPLLYLSNQCRTIRRPGHQTRMSGPKCGTSACKLGWYLSAVRIHLALSGVEGMLSNSPLAYTLTTSGCKR